MSTDFEAKQGRTGRGLTLTKADIIIHLNNQFSCYSIALLINLAFEGNPHAKAIKESIVKEYERYIFGNKLIFEAESDEDMTMYEVAIEEALAEIRKALQI